MTPARARRYSIVRHLAWSIFLNHDPARCIVTVFSDFMAAYDASGSENDRGGTLVVVGIAAPESKWGKFETAWDKVLTEFKVPYFHMKELNHRHSGEGIYAKWKGDYDTPREFLKKLVKAAKRGINKTFCYGTFLDDYHAVNGIYKLREGLGGPYLVTAGSCIDQVNNWMKRKYPRHRIVHVIEEGDCGQRTLVKRAKQQKQLVVPLPKKDPQTGLPWMQFQAADLVAGAYRDAAGKRGKVQTFEDYGEVFNDIVRLLPQRSLIHHEETLRLACEANPDQFPKR